MLSFSAPLFSASARARENPRFCPTFLRPLLLASVLVAASAEHHDPGIGQGAATARDGTCDALFRHRSLSCSHACMYATARSCAHTCVSSRMRTCPSAERTRNRRLRRSRSPDNDSPKGAPIGASQGAGVHARACA